MSRYSLAASDFRRGLIVTPVKTGVHPLNLDTVLQRYDGRLSVTWLPAFTGMMNYVLGM